MAIYYWDTSALLTLLFQEDQTNALKEKLSKQGGLPGYTAFFTFVEMESGIARRLTEGSIKPSALTGLRLQTQRLESHLALIWPDEGLLTQSRRLVMEFGLRPGDALQLASALTVAQEKEGSVVFVCLDKKLCEAALASGLASY